MRPMIAFFCPASCRLFVHLNNYEACDKHDEWEAVQVEEMTPQDDISLTQKREFMNEYRNHGPMA